MFFQTIGVKIMTTCRSQDVRVLKMSNVFTPKCTGGDEMTEGQGLFSRGLMSAVRSRRVRKREAFGGGERMGAERTIRNLSRI